MRWPRQHADTPLGELMEGQPDEAAPAAPTSDDDTAVREPLADAGTDSGADPAETEPAAADDGFLDDEDYLPLERRGPGRMTVALVAVLVLAVGVLGGVWVQKQLGTTPSASRFGAGQGAAGAGTGGGFGTGTGTGQRRTGGTAQGGTAQGGTGQAGAPGGEASGGAGGDASGSGGTGGAATGGSGTTATPAVVGTVTTAGKKSLVVTDLGGTKHTVTLTDTTTVTTPYTHGALKTGDTVAVAGRSGTDGSVTATGITVT